MRNKATAFIVFSIIFSRVIAQSPDTSQYNPLTHDTLNNTTQFNSFNKGETRYQQALVSFATSYTANRNWQNNDYKNFSLLGNVDYQYRVSAKKFMQVYQFRGELSYLKFTDSIQAADWLKNSDFFNLSTIWTEYSEKKMKHSYSVIVKSQFADSWKYSYVPTSVGSKEKIFKREWRGGLMNPATVTLAYGLNYMFWNNCYANFAFATVNVYTRPRTTDALLATEKELARTEKTFFVSEYGMSIQSLIQRKLNEYVLWDNKINFFSNGINKNQVNVDFQNRITFRFLKYLQFRVSTYLVYNPLMSYQMQYRHEFLTGIFYESRATKKNNINK